MKFLDKLMSKSYRKAITVFLIWLVIFALVIFLFIKFVYFVRENMPVALRPTIKEEKPVLSVDESGAEETEKLIVGNISVT